MSDSALATARTTSRATVLGWRPQSFGDASFRDVDDPLIEPLWSGSRVLAHVATGAAQFVDEEGADPAEPEIAAALADAVAALEAVVDGYLTADPARTGEGIMLESGIHAPTAAQMTRQLLLGGNPDRDARAQALRDPEPEPEPLGDHLVFVAVDLVALDGEPLLDVPLLERKRLLESVVVEADLVRVGIHVRPPIDPWVATWRSLGFRSAAYKAANSRYRPGERNGAWATVVLPTR
jgi:ATP-dependent DNA ligase